MQQIPQINFNTNISEILENNVNSCDLQTDRQLPKFKNGFVLDGTLCP